MGGIANLLRQPEGEAALDELAAAALEGTTAYMCAEGPWRDCHRQVIAQQLGEHYDIWTTHILPNGKVEHHPKDHVLPAYYGMPPAASAQTPATLEYCVPIDAGQDPVGRRVGCMK